MIMRILIQNLFQNALSFNYIFKLWHNKELLLQRLNNNQLNDH